MLNKEKLEEKIYQSLKECIHVGPAVKIGPNGNEVIDLTPQFDAILKKIAKERAQQMTQSKE